MIDRQQALELMNAQGQELQQLWQQAGQLRDLHWGKTLTYSPKAFLPVTNLCRDRCSYCTFRRSPKDPKAKTMSLKEIARVSQRAAQLGCIEALMCLGDRPETAYPSYGELLRQYGAGSTAHYVEMACRVALDHGLLPHTNAGLLTKEEMAQLRPVNVSLGLMLENSSPRLRQKGQAHAAAPDKDPELRIEMIRQAGELQIPFTTGILMGIGETDTEIIDSLCTIRELQQEGGHIQEVIIQAFRSKPDTPMASRDNPDDRLLAKVIAIARLLMPEMSIQAPPNLSPDGHSLLIEAGINDWGGISPLTIDFINPEAPWPAVQELRMTCRAGGFDLLPRLPIYPAYYQSQSQSQSQTPNNSRSKEGSPIGRYVDGSLHQRVLEHHARLQGLSRPTANTTQ